VCLAPTLLAAPALADGPEVLIGAGYSGLDGDHDAFGGFVEARTGSLLDVWRLSFGLGASVFGDLDGDWWVGAGPVATLALSPAWRLEASVMPGYYDRGSGRDLGDDFEIRSLLGVSYAVAAATRVGVAVTHLSNAGNGDYNPGEDSVFAFVAQSF
jgi:hypothetical protein